MVVSSQGSTTSSTSSTRIETDNIFMYTQPTSIIENEVKNKENNSNIIQNKTMRSTRNSRISDTHENNVDSLSNIINLVDQSDCNNMKEQQQSLQDVPKQRSKLKSYRKKRPLPQCRGNDEENSNTQSSSPSCKTGKSNEDKVLVLIKNGKVSNQNTVASSSKSSIQDTGSRQSAESVPAKTSSKSPPIPPPKKKKKQTYQDQVLAHLSKSMKPFTLKTLASELRTTDVALHHLMLSLLDKQIIKKKEFGTKRKKELYYLNSDQIMKNCTNTIANAEERKATKAQLRNYLTRESTLEHKVKQTLSELSNNALVNRIKEEENNMEQLRLRLDAVRGRSTNNNNKNNVKTLEQMKVRINTMRNEWRIRKEKCTDFLDNLADAMEKKTKDIAKVLEIETDQMMGVTMPPKHVIGN